MKGFSIIDDLIHELEVEESKIIRELQVQYEKITEDYNQELKKYIEWRINQKKSFSNYERKNKLQGLKEQRDEITRDIHIQMSWIRLIQHQNRLH